jgi:RNA polymerase sigma-70 factor (ECF subfamily)
MQLAELFARHHVELYRYAARFTGDADLAEDVVQDVFVRLAERPPADDGQIRGWLFRVATTIAIDAMRGARRRLALVRDRPDRQPLGDPPPDPAAELERAETRRRVRKALDELGEKERAVLLMREEGFAHREIAAAVGTTTQSVGTMIARALDKLARHLDLDEEGRP